MIINRINLNSYTNYKAPSFFKGLKQDVFEKKQSPSFKGVPFGVDNSFLDKINNMSEYELEMEMSQIPTSTKDLAYKSYEMAKLTEKMLDEKYGKNKWVFVSIGTSPAGIAKALELRNHDVRYLPISDVRRIRDDALSFYMSKEYPEYFEYLDSIRLRKDKINNDDKHYVFADFVFNGKTLSRLKDFAYSRGVDPEKAHFLGLNDELDEYTRLKEDKKGNEKADYYFTYYCMTQHIEYYAAVPHIPYNDTSQIQEKLSYSNKRNVNQSTFEKALCYYHVKDLEQS